ncbi:hypothetical protein ES288_A03G160800v1 [Gossypium darwinii]|uniref:Uncharacterized protein n=1 Tax=Gossypium darwinii TaxID=34276 RepID=A0A5D2H518_GOSDA|nr:hypothetical protein ES288_A03G160800v1 [Gossypium darwinii]
MSRFLIHRILHSTKSSFISYSTFSPNEKNITSHYCPLPLSLTKHIRPPYLKPCLIVLVRLFSSRNNHRHISRHCKKLLKSFSKFDTSKVIISINLTFIGFQVAHLNNMGFQFQVGIFWVLAQIDPRYWKIG